MKTVLPFASPLRLNFGTFNLLPAVGVGLLYRWVSGLVLAMAMCCTHSALAQKGQPKPAPTPAPQGTIFLARASSTGALSLWGTKTDGSGLTQVLPSGFSGQSYFLAVTPSDMVYGTDPMHDRWWLTYGVTNYYDEVLLPLGRSGSPPRNWIWYSISRCCPFHCGLIAVGRRTFTASNPEPQRRTEACVSGIRLCVGITSWTPSPPTLRSLLWTIRVRGRARIGFRNGRPIRSI